MKIIKILTLLAALVFLTHAVFTQWYETGSARLISPLLFIADAAFLIAFFLRKPWSWQFVAWLAAGNVGIDLIFWPEAPYFGANLLFARLLLGTEATLLAAIGILMMRTSTQKWFRENARLTMTFDIPQAANSHEGDDTFKAIRVTTYIRKRDILLQGLSHCLFPCLSFWINAGCALVMTWIAIGDRPISMAVIFAAVVCFILLWGITVILSLAASLLIFPLRPSMKRGVLGEHRFSLSPEGLIEETQYNRTLHTWPSVNVVRKFCGALMIRVEKGWHTFPCRTFGGDLTRDQFAEMIASFRAC